MSFNTIDETTPSWPVPWALGGCQCGMTGWIGREWTLGTKAVCTCGAGDPEDFNVLHAVDCDAVPCPFCPLEAEDNGTGTNL